ncbi:hypothetical protein PRZ48_011596 [Zasmidium cellare]|uniref:Uncharacterized protein n=1 Tax=Zasmidium cellare TaxID=395010 RepID=A0ABR0E6T5_ZASCE|nr:hypothetical protein PRZ48_011596 [Zasmidium cellare]
MAKTGFLDIPPELRCIIYSLLLDADCDLEVFSAPQYGKTSQPIKLEMACRGQLSPSILRVNKEIHKEAAPILYGGNVFRSEYGGQLTAFVQRIGDSAQHLRNIGYKKHEFKKDLRALLKALKPANQLSFLSLPIELLAQERYLATYSPRSLADQLAPFLRALQRQQRKETDKKARDLTEVVHLNIDGVPWISKERSQAWKARAEANEKVLKGLIAEKLALVKA